MPLFDAIYDLFNGNQDAHDLYNENPQGYFEQHNVFDVTSQDIQSEMPRVLAAVQGQSGDVSQGGNANFSGSGVVTLPPPPSAEAYAAASDGGGFGGALETLNHYTNVYNQTTQVSEDNDTTFIDDADTTVDNSVNQNIEAFGDVVQDFDNDVITGDGNANAGDNSQVNSGDGAVQVGDDLEDSTVVTGGTVGGSVTGAIEDSNVVGGNANGAVIGSDVEDSVVGNNNTSAIDNDDSAIGFGEGDVANDSNVLSGQGTLQTDIDGDANAATNIGGNQNVAQQSELDESAIGGSVESNDIDIDDSNVAFGDGDAGDTDVDVDGPVDGNVQVATGDNNDQTALNDESINTEVEIDDSFNDESVNTAINESFNEETDVDDSFNTEVDTDIDESFNEVEQDDDGVVDL